ncbi:hypothetical protein BpHYR1_021545 [Brachionus plicatilis]|nr:hypothetical protein BpHYR1_021545 [Brachionus plicatilis]
MLFLVQP